MHKQFRHLSSKSFYLFTMISLILIGNCVSFQDGESKDIESSDTNPEFYNWIWISEDPMLREILSERYEKENPIEKDIDFKRIASVEIESIDSSIPAHRSLLYSLATLTIGIFHDIESDYVFVVRYLEDTKQEKKMFQSKTVRKFRTPMPPYIGFASSIILASFDRYRKPEHLRNYCIFEKPSRLRESLEATHTEYCKEYKSFLFHAWLSIEKKVQNDLSEIH
ncbi:hypothetical protein [Leptospira sp. GIMC2001]|uniref:hypothetical protein n=1 Tax=Leptospira sp. GIMC2001 TaxID=1513297 RepID=UPI00234B1E7A|nr:hypothetical protein [Leptospira sp. GIMC2001]WCL48403.1 hypothetical protein O4O04_13955 [Leptospira sp. GIMC2001]